jgi:NAD(P)-dependent dehydrogenase (short-subunit alcohol dehydrogenase family)
MPSKFLEPEQSKRLAEHRYEFRSKALGGRVVLVTGGAGGLGAAITALLLQDGALPVVGYRTHRGRALAFQQKMQDMYGGPVALVEGDIGDAAVRERYLQAALDIKGEVYGLVALPGDPARVKPEELDAEALRASFAANYEAPVLLARATAERMVRQGTKGAIVLVSSMQGVHPFEGSLAYASPKAALLHAARILAKEYGGAGDIRVNAVAPGATVAGWRARPSTRGNTTPTWSAASSALRPAGGRRESRAAAARARLVRHRAGDHGGRRADAAAGSAGVGGARSPVRRPRAMALGLARAVRDASLVQPERAEACAEVSCCVRCQGPCSRSSERSRAPKTSSASYWLWRRQRSEMLSSVARPPRAYGTMWWNSRNVRSVHRCPFLPTNSH